MDNYDSIVIGGGISGLASSIILAKRGQKVLLLEKNPTLGGMVGRIQKYGFTWDSGASHISRLDIFEDFFSSLGENIDEYLKFLPLPDTKYFFNEPTYLQTQLSDLEDMEKPGVLEKYNKRCQNIQKNFEKYFVNKNFSSSTQMYFPNSLIGLKKIGAFEEYGKLIQDFENPELKQILSYPIGCLGLDIEKEYEAGVARAWNRQQFYIKGGIYNIVLALEKMAKKFGVEIKTGENIESFLVKDGKAIGVSSSRDFFAKNIISSIDRRISEKMLGDYRDYDEQYFEKKHFSPSGYVLHLGINKRLGNLAHHNYIFSSNFYDEMKNLKHGKTLFHEPSIYVCCPTQTDKSLAPEKCEILSILVHTPANFELSQEQMHDYAGHIVGVLEDCIDEEITRYVVQKHIMSMKTYQEEFSNPSGSIYGLSSNINQIGGFRPINYSKRIKNIYYVGHTTSLAGISYGLVGAKLACQRIK